MAKVRLGPWQWEVIPGGKKPEPFNVVYILKDLPFQVTKRYTGVVVDMKRTFRIGADDYSPTWRLDYNDVGMWSALTNDKYDSPQEAAVALDHYLKSDQTRWSKNADEQARLPVTIYSKSPMGSIGKVEGFLTEVNASGTGGAVSYIPKRGRREQVIMTYYSSFIMVVEGWNKPDPESGLLPATPGSQPGVSVSRSRYRSTDPRWVSDFMAGPGKNLRPIVLFEDGRLVKNTTNLARTAGFKTVLRIAAEMPAGSTERRDILKAVAAATRWDLSDLTTDELERRLADVKRHQMRGEGEDKSNYLAALSRELKEREHDKTALQPSYHNLLTDLVQHIDGMEDGQKKHAAKANHILGILGKLVAKDPAFGGEDSNARFGGKQVLDDMQDAIAKFIEASNNLGHVYDELNSWMSRNGPR